MVHRLKAVTPPPLQVEGVSGGGERVAHARAPDLWGRGGGSLGRSTVRAGTGTGALSARRMRS